MKRQTVTVSHGGGAPETSSLEGFTPNCLTCRQNNDNILNMLGNKESRNKKCGFTLAEVLITLGIIGIVAALTLPGLIAKYKKLQYVTGLKKFYSTFSNGIKMMMADTGCSETKCLGFDGDINDPEWNERMDMLFKKYFKVVKVCITGNETCSEAQQYYLSGKPIPKNQTDDKNARFFLYYADGMRVSLGAPGEFYNEVATDNNTKYKYVSLVTIDVNGDKKPNTSGRDVFNFRLANDGTLLPYVGKEYSDFVRGHVYWKDYDYFCGKPGVAEISDDVKGSGCSARVIENGWVMDY